jgi:hypothetical protein
MLIDEHELKARIEYSRVLADYNKTELANKLKMSTSTFKRKMENPLRLTIAEYFELSDALMNDILIDYLKEVMKIKSVKKVSRRKKIQ